VPATINIRGSSSARYAAKKSFSFKTAKTAAAGADAAAAAAAAGGGGSAAAPAAAAEGGAAAGAAAADDEDAGPGAIGFMGALRGSACG
jgi:hypothetical protein